MEQLRKITRRYYLRQIISSWMICAMLFGLTPARIAMADATPGDNVLPSGLIDSVGVDAPVVVGNDMTINQTANEAIMNWNNFDIGKNAGVEFLQPGATSAVLNRVHDGDVTGIMGRLTANGRVFIINPAGIVFGKTAVINVSQLVASSLELTDEDFLNGAPYEFVAKRDELGKIISGDVIFNAKAEKVLAERIMLIGKDIWNKGGLKATDYVVMAAGDKVLISEEGSSVAVVVSMGSGTPGDFTVRNQDISDGVATKLEADHVIIAAGDLWSQAITSSEDIIKTVDIYAAGEIEAGDLSTIDVYSGPGSDAVAGVSIASGSNVTIDDDITATAIGNGVDNAIATIDISSGGDLTIKSKNSSGTELLAKAIDGVNNEAEVSLIASGVFTIDAPDEVSVQAEAGSECYDGALSQAKVNISADSVLIRATDLGSTDRPATVSANAYNSTVNRAGVDIQSVGDVAIIGAGSNGDSAIVEAVAECGSENYANVTINAGGDIDIIAEEGQSTDGTDTTEALVRAIARNADVLNEAVVKLTAGGDVHVKSKGGQTQEWQTLNTPANWDVKIKQKIQDTPETWDVKIQKWHQTGYWSWQGYWEYSWMQDQTSQYPTPPSGWQLANVWTDHHAATYHYDYDWIYGAGSTHPSLSGYPGWSLDGATVFHPATYDDHSSFTPYVAAVEAIAENAGHSNTANVDITAGGDIVVLSEDGGEARVEAYAGNSYSSHNTANINLTAQDGYVLVHAIGGTETTEDGFTESEASVEATAENAGGMVLKEVEQDGIEEDISTNNAKITIIARDIPEPVIEEPTEPEPSTDLEVLVSEVDDKSGDVMVIGVEGGNAKISANAESGDENAAGVEIRADGDVKVIAECGSEAEIEAIAMEGQTNNADVLICINGGVEVKGEKGGEAEIEALAKYGYSNTASVGIGAKGEEGVQVIADRGGEAGISSKAKDGWNNTASTIVCTKGGVDVLATRGGEAGIVSQAVDGLITNAYVGVCAVGDVVVQAGEEFVEGCTALIRSEAESRTIVYALVQEGPSDGFVEIEPSTADARTVVVSHQGNVEVLAYNHGHSGIEAEAQGAHKNTASVGVAAGADLSPSDVIVLPEPPPIPDDLKFMGSEFVEGPYYSTGNVIVKACGDSEAQILAYAHDASPIYEYPDTPPSEPVLSVQEVEIPDVTIIPGENKADVVICAPGKVVVEADRSSEARIKSKAGWHEDEGTINTAKTQVYASEVKVDVSSARHGQGIWAYADNVDGSPRVSNKYCLTVNGEVAEIVTNEDGSSAELIIKDYSQRVDCPDCPPCPCEEAAPASAPAAAIPAPVAPLPTYAIPRIEGCPQLTQAAAAELGIPEETLQVGLGDALAINPNLQACQACASLLNAATVLKDADGSRMAAMMQVFNAMAPADAPFTPEMSTSIAMAFEGAAEGSEYASAMEFIDAFVQYASALDEMGSPVGDSTAFVMEKYGAGISGNANMSSYVAGRIQSGETF